MSKTKEAVLAWLDKSDGWLCSRGILRGAQWSLVTSGKVSKLYAGKLYRGHPQYRTHFGLTPYEPSSRNIAHDVRDTMPIPDCAVDIYQSEDVFEHVPYADIPAIFDEVFRILKPSGLFRLSLPDYRSDVLADRTLRDTSGKFIFDPVGGGQYIDGQVIHGGHLWFPTYEKVLNLFEGSRFASGGKVQFLHYITEQNRPVLNDIDYSLGFVRRTPDHDSRAMSPRRPLSIVVDAVKL